MLEKINFSVSSHGNLLLIYLLKHCFQRFLFLLVFHLLVKMGNGDRKKECLVISLKQNTPFAFVSILIVKAYTDVCIYGLLFSVSSHKGEH